MQMTAEERLAGELLMYAVRRKAADLRDTANRLIDMCDDDYENVTNSEVYDAFQAAKRAVSELEFAAFDITRGP